MAHTTSESMDASRSTSDIDFKDYETSPSSESTTPVNVVDFRKLLAEQTVKHWSQWTSVAGLIPVSLLDTVAISSLQVKMIYELCKVYDVPFHKETIRSLVSGLLGGSVTSLASGYASSILLRHLPYVGSALSVVSQPVIAYASTLAIGTVFIKHFESQGNLQDFAVESVREFYDEQFAKVKSKLKVRKSKDASVFSNDPGLQA